MDLWNPLYPLTRVDDLINEHNHCWNTNLISQWLLVYIAQQITEILVSCTTQQYRLVWAFYKKGLYTVMSAYVGMITKVVLPGLQVYQRFKILWKLQVPSKIKFSAWQLANDCLPVSANLINHHIQVDEKCIRWNSTETSLYLLVDCDFARVVWGALDLYGLVTQDLNGGITHCLDWTLQEAIKVSQEENVFTMFLCMIRILWKAKNVAKSNDDVSTPITVIDQVKLYAHDIYSQSSNTQVQQPTCKVTYTDRLVQS